MTLKFRSVILSVILLFTSSFAFANSYCENLPLASEEELNSVYDCITGPCPPVIKAKYIIGIEYSRSVGADLSGSCIESLGYSQIQTALINANLSNTVVISLFDANLSGSTLAGTRFLEILDIKSITWDGATYDSTTVWPSDITDEILSDLGLIRLD